MTDVAVLGGLALRVARLRRAHSLAFGSRRCARHVASLDLAAGNAPAARARLHHPSGSIPPRQCSDAHIRNSAAPPPTRSGAVDAEQLRRKMTDVAVLGGLALRVARLRRAH